MIIGGDIAHDGCPGEPANDRHQELEEAKMECQPEDRAPAGGVYLGACTQADGKGIHGHAQGKKKNFEEVQ